MTNVKAYHCKTSAYWVKLKYHIIFQMSKTKSTCWDSVISMVSGFLWETIEAKKKWKTPLKFWRKFKTNLDP